MELTATTHTADMAKNDRTTFSLDSVTAQRQTGG